MMPLVRSLVLVLLAGIAIGQALGGEPPTAPAKTLDVPFTDAPPRIDGSIDESWGQADSTTDFIQSQPFENASPSERTVVYLLQDRENLYVGFRYWSLKHPPTANFTKDEEYVSIAIDPFGSRTTGYFFQLFGSGLFWDGMVLDDGRSYDMSWKGVWYRAAKIHPDRMEVTMKIPFKTIRYKKGLSQWGLQFRRHIADPFEDDYWTEVTQKDGDLVSRWGTMRNIHPQSSGYHFELYPEAFVRYDNFRSQDKATLKPKASLTFKWDLTSQTSLNATTYPDFAQIESDPFSVNLSRYPRYLQEQRPFFVEGLEIFRMSDFGNGNGWFTPLNLFYSRRIGKSIDGSVVPIIGGVKLTHKTEAWNFGTLASLTDFYRNDREGVDEPQRQFGVFRLKRRVLSNSDIGVMASGMSRNRQDYNLGLGLDAAWRHGPNQLVVQGGRSDRNGKRDWALSSGFNGFLGKFLTMGAYEAVGDSFDVSEIGFVPWTGRQRAMVLSGPFLTFRRGSLRNLFVGGGVSRTLQPGNPNWSTVGVFVLNPNLRNNWGCNVELDYGRMFEADTNYLSKNLGFNFYGMVKGNNINGNFNYGYGYNYQRGFLAWQGSNSLTFSYSFCSPLSATLRTNLWAEWDSTGQVLALWPWLSPRVDYRISALMTLSAFNELVGNAPQTHLSKTRLQSNRLGVLYSWNFSPKSWVYIALNQYNALDYSERPDGEMKQQYAIGAVKVKYLLYF